MLEKKLCIHMSLQGRGRLTIPGTLHSNKSHGRSLSRILIKVGLIARSFQDDSNDILYVGVTTVSVELLRHFRFLDFSLESPKIVATVNTVYRVKPLA